MNNLLEKCQWLLALFEIEEIKALYAAYDQAGHFIGIGFTAHGQFTQYADPARAEAIQKLENLYRHDLIEIEEQGNPKVKLHRTGTYKPPHFGLTLEELNQFIQADMEKMVHESILRGHAPKGDQTLQDRYDDAIRRIYGE